jgi:lipopolysaccharide assembly outer membrane protein LptD (OstA)
MKRLTLIGILACALTITVQAEPQTAATQPSQINVTATKIVHDGLVIHAIGKVVVQIDKDTVIEADEADLHSDTTEIELRGHITVRTTMLGQSFSVIKAEKITYRPLPSK